MRILRKITQISLVFKINLMKLKFRRFVKRKRATYHERVINYCHHCLTCVRPMLIHDTYQRTAATRIKRFLFVSDY